MIWSVIIIARSTSVKHVGFRGVFLTTFGFMQCAFLVMSFLSRRKCIARKAQNLSEDHEDI